MILLVVDGKPFCKLNARISKQWKSYLWSFALCNEAFLSDGCSILPCRPRLSKMNTMLQDRFLGSSSSKQEQQYRHGAQNESKTSTLRKLWAYLTILSHCLSATSHLSCRLLDMVPVSPLPIPLFWQRLVATSAWVLVSLLRIPKAS